MKNIFKIIDIQDRIDDLYILTLQHNDNEDEYKAFGIYADTEEYYRSNCWRAEVNFDEGVVAAILSYIDDDGNIHEYAAIDGEFKNVLLKYINRGGYND